MSGLTKTAMPLAIMMTVGCVIVEFINPGTFAETKRSSMSSYKNVSSTKINIDKNIIDAINKSSRKYGVDAKLVKCVIQQESNFNPYDESDVGAKGLMQLMPGTANSLGVIDVWDIEQNVDGGTKYLKQQLDKFGSPEQALAAYNAGPGNVQKYGGIPPFEETQNYVKNIMKDYKGL